MGDDFLNSSLCIWLTRTFEQLQPPTNLFHLSDGEFLNKIMANISPARFTMSRINKDVGDDPKQRIENLNSLLKNLIFYYEEILNSILISKLPDVRLVGSQPQSYLTVVELEKLFTLILGVAFQCDNKNMYIERVQHLPEVVQKELMTKLQELTETNDVVMSSYIEPESLQKPEVDGLCHVMLTSLQNVVLERNEIHEKYIRVANERDDYLAQQSNRSGRRSTISLNESFTDSRDSSRPNTPAYNTEIAELRAKLLKYEDEIETKTDLITRLKEESAATNEQISRLKNEYRTLYDDAQAARIYRDEIDSLRTKAEKLDKYEADIAKYRDKLEDMEYLKNRVKELKNHNDQLMEMNELLKEELVSSEQINKAMIAEEEKNIKLRAMLEELSAQKEYGDRVIQDMTNKKKQVELELKHSANMISQMQKEIDELTASNNEIRMAMLERDGVTDSHKYVTIEKELSLDDNGQTPIINRRRSTVWEGSKDESMSTEVQNSKIKRLEMDNLHLKTQTENLRNSNAKLQMLEQNTEKDKLQLDTNKAELVRLQEQINLEKTRVEGFQQKLSEAHIILKEIGYDTEKLNEVNVISDREKFLKYEERLKQSLNHSLKMKEERISVLEDRVKENTNQNDSLRQELSIIKRQNKSYQKQNKSLQQSLDESVTSISTSPSRRISKGSQYEHHVSLSSTPIKQEHHVSLSSTPIKQRLSASLALTPISNISSIKENNENKSPNKSEILDVSYESVSLSESRAALELLRQDCVDLKEENDQLFLDRERLEQEVQELQLERKSHLTEIQNLREKHIDSKSDVSDLDRENKKKSMKLEEFEIACTALEDMNEKLKRACEELENEKNYMNAQCNKLLIQNQELLIKTIEDQEKNREETRVFQDQIMSMKQDNQALAMSIALKSQTSESSKKKPFYKALFKSKKAKTKEEMAGGTPNIDEYIEQLSLDSAERLTPPEYDSNGYFLRETFLDSDNSSRTMSGDGRLELGSVNSLGRIPDTSHISSSSASGFKSAGISRTLSTDSERRTQSADRDLTPKRHGSLRLKNKSESFDLTPRVEARSMARPLPPGTHGTPDHRSELRADHRPPPSMLGTSSSLSAQSLLNSTTANRAHEVLSDPPSAFRQYNNNPAAAPTLPPRNHRHHDMSSRHHDMSSRHHDTSSTSSRQQLQDSSNYCSDSEFRPRSSASSVSEGYSQRGIHDEDPRNSSYYEYGCV
ncbi:girdin-like isoform X2 [Bolinopsis microptera]|uniref:girdin-like isoform X2 n=1 Tax=Bolinopsis microptera TaxID=2820187 RepID=UPI0030794050